MAVKFTKPEINVREKLAELDKPSGIAGEAMLRAETPQEQFNLIGAVILKCLREAQALLGYQMEAHTPVIGGSGKGLVIWR